MTKETSARVKNVTPLTNSILRLDIEPEQYIDYKAGQYLEILVDGNWLAYSIANAPLGAPHYELHIRHAAGNPYDEPLFAQIKAHEKLSIRLPQGSCCLSTFPTERPILFVVGGTGLAPAKAIIEEVLATSDPRKMALWWAVRSQSDLYLDEQLQAWSDHVPQFEYHYYLADEDKRPMLDRLQKTYKEEIADYELFLAGPFVMVYATRDRFLRMGVQRENMHSDAFSFEEK